MADYVEVSDLPNILAEIRSEFASKLHGFEAEIEGGTFIQIRFYNIFKLWDSKNYFKIKISITMLGRCLIEFETYKVDKEIKQRSEVLRINILSTIGTFLSLYYYMHEDTESVTPSDTHPSTSIFQFTDDFKSFCRGFANIVKDFTCTIDEFTDEIDMKFTYSFPTASAQVFTVNLSTVQTPGVYVATFKSGVRLIYSKQIPTLKQLAKAVSIFIGEIAGKSIVFQQTKTPSKTPSSTSESDTIKLLEETRSLLDKIMNKIKS
jgi:hypothetical protein